MKLFKSVLVLALVAAACIIGGIVYEYCQPYRKIVIRCDAGKVG
jgi:hypothetical protein